MKDLFDVEQLTQFEFGAIVLTVLIAGLAFGCLIAWGLLKRKDNPNAVTAAKIQQEFEEYKEKVDEHFDKTSEMFKDVTTQYKKLYDHMAVGAIELGNADTITMPRLEVQNSDEEPEPVDEQTDSNDSDDNTDNVTDAEETQTDNQEPAEQGATSEPAGRQGQESKTG